LGAIIKQTKAVRMPDAAFFDLNFRPASYWGPQSFETRLGSHIKGELRRQAALKDHAHGFHDADLAAESLSKAEREAAGQIHPWLMGGEYLPDFMPNEVEIARVVMKSVTMDVVSIRARQTKHRVIYRIVDEYEDSLESFTLAKKTSVHPLSLSDLIKMIDFAVDGGLVGGNRDFMYEDPAGSNKDPHELYDFASAYSAFYPELEAWYEKSNAEWLERELPVLSSSQEKWASLTKEFWDWEHRPAVLVWSNGPGEGPSGWLFQSGCNWSKADPVEIWDSGRIISEDLWTRAFPAAAVNLSKLRIQLVVKSSM
jgi:hypothetical protein